MTDKELIEFLMKQVEDFQGQITSLTSTIDDQSNTISQLNQTINKLNLTIDKLNRRIQELTEQLNKNSRNSSKPPSSDGFKKEPKSLRKPSGSRQGAQKGHPGTHLMMTAEPDTTVTHMPSGCEACPNHAICKASAEITESRDVIDVITTVNITRHQTLEIAVCPMHRDDRVGTFPENVKAAVQYGENLQALAVALNTVGSVSIQRTHEILSGVFNIPISTGTLSNMIKRCAQSVDTAWRKIKTRITDAPLAHFDETGTRVDKKLHWVHNASDSNYTYLDISQKRGQKGMDECDVLPNFSGIAVHDCWASYWNYPVEHSVCCAHLLRELIGISENHPDQTWANGFIDLLLEMKKIKDKAISKGKTCLSYYHLHKFNKQYDKLISDAKDQNPLPEPAEKKRGRKKKGKILALVARLENYKASVCLFVNNFNVPFDNNQAERDIRMIKVKTKVSGCFRTLDGARDYLKIMSFVSTARKHGKNAFETLLEAISGNPDFIFE